MVMLHSTLIIFTLCFIYEHVYLKFQNFEFDGDNETCALEWVFPRKLPNQTSYPWLASMKASIKKYYLQ